MENLEKDNPQTISGKRVVLTSTAVDILDILLNGSVAFLTGSVAMLAETLQGVADLFSDILIYTGLRRSKQAPTKKHPLGFGRELYFWTLLASLMMFVVLAGLSIYFGLDQFFNPDSIEMIYLAFLVLGVSVVTNGYAFSLSLRRLIDKESRLSLWQQFSQSDKTETKATLVSDTVGTLSAISGLIALGLYQLTGDLRFDGVGAIAIGVFMAVFSFTLFLNIKGFLVGKSIPKTELEKIRSVVSGFSEVNKILSLKALSFGPNQAVVYLEINAQDDLVTDQIENLVDRIEKRIKEEVPSARNIMVEMEG